MLRFWFMHNFYNFFYKMLKAFFITSMYYCLIKIRQGSDCLKKKPVLFLKTTFSLLFFKPWVSFEIAVSNLRYIAVRKVKYSCIKHIVIHEDSSFGLFLPLSLVQRTRSASLRACACYIFFEMKIYAFVFANHFGAKRIHFKVLNASSLAIIIGISADYLTINGN